MFAIYVKKARRVRLSHETAQFLAQIETLNTGLSQLELSRKL